MDDILKYLFPAYRIMHCGIGDNYIEYPLSKVLGSWGLTIREIWIGRKTAEIRCYAGKDGEINNAIKLEIMSLSELVFDLPVTTHYLDLILRYDKDEQHNLSLPKWTKAIWMNLGGCVVLDAVGQKSYVIQFEDACVSGSRETQ